MYRGFFKRFFDFMFALLGLIVLSPIFLILMIWIKLDSKGPIVFKQKRVGKDGRYFNILKFRTMKIDTPDVPTHLLENPDQYITKVGKMLRKTSLDELPQIINILKGDMSIIGPRPALWNQEDLNQLRSDKGIDCLSPGLTGWAQINGRDEIEISDKVELDNYYLEHVSILFDIKVFFGTIFSVVKSDGVKEGKV